MVLGKIGDARAVPVLMKLKCRDNLFCVVILMKLSKAFKKMEKIDY
jgi:hypothetical protein